MKSRNKHIIFILAIIFWGSTAGQTISVNSPDGKIALRLFITEQELRYAVEVKGKMLILHSAIKVTVNDVELGSNASLISVEEKTVENQWENAFGERRIIPNNYNQTRVFLQSNGLTFHLICRAYNEGVALSYEIPQQTEKESVVITDEHISFVFPQDYPAWATYWAQGPYNKVPISKIRKGCERPLVIECEDLATIALAETRLVDYARMKFGPDDPNTFSVRTNLHGVVHKQLPFQSPCELS